MRSHSPPLPSICEALYHVPEPAEPSQPSEYLPAHPPLLSESSIVLYDALEPRCAAQFPYPHSPTFRDLPERPSPSLGRRRAALRSCQASAGPTSVPRSVPSTSADSKLHNAPSRRCFVCARTNKHRLGFQFCPRTHTLLRRNLVRISAAGRLVHPDGSALPMTRHPGGVAGHLIAQYNRVLRSPEPHARVPASIRVPIHHIPSTPRIPINSTRDPIVFELPEPRLHPSSPHGVTPAPRMRTPKRTDSPCVLSPCASCISTRFSHSIVAALTIRDFRRLLTEIIRSLDLLDTGDCTLHALLPDHIIHPLPPPCFLHATPPLRTCPFLV